MMNDQKRRIGFAVMLVALCLIGTGVFVLSQPDAVDVSKETNNQRRSDDVNLQAPTSKAAQKSDSSAAVQMNIPAVYQFAGNSTFLSANNSKELMLRYTEEQQTLIKSHYGRFGAGSFNLTEYAIQDIFTFRNTEQLKWLLEQGFPTPDDILSASAMSDAELSDLADMGNMKAIAFLLARDSGPVIQTGEPSLGDLAEVLRRGELENQALASGSAFGAYVIAAQAIAADQPGMALAAYYYAQRLGDERGSAFAVQGSGLHNLDAREALSSFIALQSRAASKNPQLRDLRNLDRVPRFPMWE